MGNDSFQYDDPMIGSTLGGKFRIEQPIGQGAMGTVYRGIQVGLDRQVAVKVLQRAVAGTDEAYQRFQREARIASQLRHPNIIEVYDFDHTADGLPYLVMEFLEGDDLEGFIHDHVEPDPAEVLAVFKGVCSALAYAHERGVIHRDLKPQNIMLCHFGDEQDFPKVLDFGISKLRNSDHQLTQTQAYLGTPYYMAPEQARGRSGDVDARSDIFALGAMLYRALCGRFPFNGSSLEAVLYQIVHEQPEPLCLANPRVPAPLSRAVHWALAKEPDGRPNTANELHRELSAALEESLSHPGGTGELIRPGARSSAELAAPSAPDDLPELLPPGEAPTELAESDSLSTSEVLPLVNVKSKPGSPSTDEVGPPPPKLEVMGPADTTMGNSIGEQFAAELPMNRRLDRKAMLAGLVLLLGGATVGGWFFVTRAAPPAGPRSDVKTSASNAPAPVDAAERPDAGPDPDLTVSANSPDLTVIKKESVGSGKQRRVERRRRRTTRRADPRPKVVEPAKPTPTPPQPRPVAVKPDRGVPPPAIKPLPPTVVKPKPPKPVNENRGENTMGW